MTSTTIQEVTRKAKKIRSLVRKAIIASRTPSKKAPSGKTVSQLMGTIAHTRKQLVEGVKKGWQV